MEQHHGLCRDAAILGAAEGKDVDAGAPGHVGGGAAQAGDGVGEARAVHMDGQAPPASDPGQGLDFRDGVDGAGLRRLGEAEHRGAAMMDGASHVQTFFKIILPLVQPILAACGLLIFVGTIGEFLLASLFLRTSTHKTLATGLYGLIADDRSNNLGVFAAGAVLTAIPVIGLFLYLQRFIVGGMTAGGVKG
jgi:hypothetical protein